MTNDLPNTNGQDAQSVVVVSKPKRPSNIWLIIVAALFIIVPFLTWYLTWFGRGLSDQELTTYLSDQNNPRHIQHALLQVEAKIEKGEPAAKQFYPQIINASKSSVAEVRKTAAWVMGADNKSDDFHNALLPLLKDDDPLVRRNAALQLVRFGDASGRDQLRAMLQPYEAKPTIPGTIVGMLPPGSTIRAGGMLARIKDASNNLYEFRSPVDGKIAAPGVVNQGDQITANQTIARLVPDQATVVDALRALAYVGTKEDLPLIEETAQNNNTAEISAQASQTLKAIHTRSDQSGQ